MAIKHEITFICDLCGKEEKAATCNHKYAVKHIEWGTYYQKSTVGTRELIDTVSKDICSGCFHAICCESPHFKALISGKKWGEE
jgi:hypothetical protein